MGNKIEKETQYGKIMIWSQKETYVAGDQFQGYVYLNLDKDFPSNTIQLIISGKEKVKIADSVISGTHDDPTSTVKIYEEENEFYNYNFPLYQFPGNTFPKGHYQFPFTFKFEDNLPGSFHHQWLEHGEQCYGSIQYNIWAGFKDQQTNDKLFDRFDFKIDQKYQSLQQQQSKQFEDKLQGYCYSNLGTVKMQCIFADSNYITGQNAQVKVKINTENFNASIEKINFQLKQVTNLIAKDKDKKIMKKLNSVSLQGPTQNQNENYYTINLPISTVENQASCDGILISNKFVLCVSLDLDKCLCYSAQPYNELDIKVFNPQQIQEAPNFFNEQQNQQVMDTYVATLNEDYRMTKDFQNTVFVDHNIDYPNIEQLYQLFNYILKFLLIQSKTVFNIISSNSLLKQFLKRSSINYFIISIQSFIYLKLFQIIILFIQRLYY